MRLCEGCGGELPTQHGNRKWCSEKCRRNQYAGTCQVCGVATTGCDGPGLAPDICQGCWATRFSERTERIIAAWNRWEPAWLIAEREGISETNVLSIVDQRRQAGQHVILHRDRNRTNWEAVERMFRAGLSNGEMAERLGTNAGNIGTMISTMREAGYDLPRRKRWQRRSEEDWDRLREMWIDGTSVEDVAESFGISERTVYIYIGRLRKKGYDIPRRPPGRKPVSA